MISLKICLNISLVSSSHALMSSVLIPLLSGDLPFLSLMIAVRNSSVVISGILVISLVFVVMHIDCCSHFHSHRFLVQILLVHCRRIFLVEFTQRHWQSLVETWWFLLSHSLSWWWALSSLQIWFLKRWRRKRETDCKSGARRLRNRLGWALRSSNTDMDSVTLAPLPWWMTMTMPSNNR